MDCLDFNLLATCLLIVYLAMLFPKDNVYYPLQVLDRGLAVLPPAAVFTSAQLRSILVRLEGCYLGTIHIGRDVVCLPLLERCTETFVRIVLVISLVFVVLDTDEVGVDGSRIERQTDEGIDDGGLGDDLECPLLLYILAQPRPGPDRR